MVEVNRARADFSEKFEELIESYNAGSRTIEALDSGLPRPYTPDLYTDKCSAVFEHVYESYPDRQAGVYA